MKSEPRLRVCGHMSQIHPYVHVHVHPIEHCTVHAAEMAGRVVLCMLLCSWCAAAPFEFRKNGWAKLGKPSEDFELEITFAIKQVGVLIRVVSFSNKIMDVAIGPAGSAMGNVHACAHVN